MKPKTAYNAPSAVEHTHRKGWVRRALKKREPRPVELEKIAFVVKGTKTSQTIKDILHDLAKLKGKETMKYSRNNDIRPFEDASSLEYFADKCNAGLFAFGNHSKKHPNNLIIGRLFNYRMLDMVEFGCENVKTMKDFTQSPRVESRTSIIFQGEEWENNPDYKTLESLLLDFFSERPTDLVDLKAMDHVIVFTSTAKGILMRHYLVQLKRSGSRIPRVELEECGPSIDLVVRRTRFASADLRALANRSTPLSKKNMSGKSRNISKDELFQKVGKIHVGHQNLGELQSKHPKALYKGGKREGEGASEDRTAKKQKTEEKMDE